MIPYGTLSLVGIHAQWITPVYLRATAPVAKRSLRSVKKVAVYIPGSRKAARSLVRVGQVAKVAHPRKLTGQVAKVGRVAKRPLTRRLPGHVTKRRRIKSGAPQGGRR